MSNKHKGLEEKLKDIMPGKLDDFLHYRKHYLEKFPSLSSWPLTNHGPKHCKNVAIRAGQILEYTDLGSDEIIELLFAIWLHDIGNWKPNPVTGEIQLSRKGHHKNAVEIIQNIFKEFFKELESQGRVAEHVAKLAWAHASDCPSFLQKLGERTWGTINLPLLAAVLRLADILDLTEERTCQLWLKLFELPDDSKPHHKSLDVIHEVDFEHNKQTIVLYCSAKTSEERDLVKWRVGQVITELKCCGDILAKYGIFFTKIAVQWSEKRIRDEYYVEKQDEFIRGRPPKGIKGNPFQGIEPYDDEKAWLFFGRDDDIRRVIALCRTESLVIMSGGSGVGKTSLIQAGIIPRLDKNEWISIYSRPSSEPEETIKNAIYSQVKSTKELSKKIPLLNFFLMLKRKHSQRVLVWIDQFEELFTLLSADKQKQFMKDIQTVRQNVEGVSFVLSMRAEAQIKLHNYLRDIPDLLHNIHAVLPMTQQQARQVLVEPLKRCESPLIFMKTPDLADEVINDLSACESREGGGIRPILLSIIGECFYDTLQQDNDSIITPDLYRNRLRRAQGILESHLERTLAGFSPIERELAYTLLEEMIRFEGPYYYRNPIDLKNFCNRDPQRSLNKTKEVANKLVKRGLLKLKAKGEEFELMHEYIADTLANQIPEDRRRLHEVRSYVEKQVAYAIQGSPIGLEQLQYIYNNGKGIPLLYKEIRQLLIGASQVDTSLEIFNWLFSIASMRELKKCPQLFDTLIKQEVLSTDKLRTIFNQENKAGAARVMRLLFNYYPDLKIKDRVARFLAGTDSDAIKSVLKSVAKNTSNDFILRTLAIYASGTSNKDDTVSILLKKRQELFANREIVHDDLVLKDIAWRAVNASLLIDEKQTVEIVGAEADLKAPVIQRREAVRSLHQINTPAIVPHLINSLSDEHEDIKIEAAETLAEILRETGNLEQLDIIADRLEHSDWNVRKTAAKVLHLAGNSHVKEKLEALFNKESESGVKLEICRALQMFREHGGTERLIQKLQTKTSDNQYEAILLLISDLTDPYALGAVKKFIKTCRSQNQRKLAELGELVCLGLEQVNKEQNTKAAETRIEIALQNPVWRTSEIRVLYKVRTVLGSEFEMAKRKLAEHYGSTGRIAEAQNVARVVASEYGEESKEGQFVVSFPNTPGIKSVSEVLTLVAGHCISINELKEVKINQIKLSPDLKKKFIGSSKESTQSREIFGYDGPYLYIPIYPRIGLTIGQYAERCSLATALGADIIADNELFFSETTEEIRNRVKRVKEAIIEGKKEIITCTNCNKCSEYERRKEPLYFVNVTGHSSDLLNKCHVAAESGADGFVVNILTSGFSVAESVVRFAQTYKKRGHSLKVFGYLQMHSLLTASEHSGIDLKVLLEFGRLIGIDIIHIGVPFGYLDRKATPLKAHSLDMDRNFKIITEESDAISPAIAALAGGISWSNLAANILKSIRKYNRSVVIGIGSGVWRFSLENEREKAIANIRRMRAFLNADEKTLFNTRDFLIDCPILKDYTDSLTIDYEDLHNPNIPL